MGGSIFDSKGVAIEGSGWGGAGKFASSSAGTLLFGTVAGGAGAALTGGNFWQGAATGLIVSGLNHLGHKINELSVPKVKSTVDITPEGKVTFTGLTPAQLKEFKLIPGDVKEGQTLLSPTENNVVYKVDGVYSKNYSDDKYWYKVGNGRKVNITVGKNGTHHFRDVTPKDSWFIGLSDIGFYTKVRDHGGTKLGNPFDIKHK